MIEVVSTFTDCSAIIQSEFVRLFLEKNDGTVLPFDEEPFIEMSKNHRQNQKIEIKQGETIKNSSSEECIETPISQFNKAMFIRPLLKKQLEKFSWGSYGATLGRMKRARIMLPVAPSGEPYWDYMEQYAKNLMKRKYEQYLAYLDGSVV